MNRVAVFQSTLLAVSQTFIRDQVRALRTWEPVLVGLWETQPALATPGVRREVLGTRWRSAAWRFLLARPIPALVRLLRQLHVSLVHAHFGPDAVRAWPSVRAAGLPLLVTLHGYDIATRREWWEQGHAGWAMRLYPRRLLRMARHPAVRFIVVSQAIRQRAIDYGIPADKISVVHIGVDTSRFTPGGPPLEQRRRRILFVGRMVEKKAPLLLVRAFADVRRTVPDAELAMLGDGPLLEDARKLAGELGVPVEFLGAGSSDDVLSELREARVLCLPSITARNGDAEGLPMVLLEAQACGVPVVTSTHDGTTEGLVHGQTGYGFREGDLEDMVAKLCRVLEAGSAAGALSVAAARFASGTFDLGACSRQLELLYDSHLATCHHR